MLEHTTMRGNSSLSQLEQELIEMASQALTHAYAPYSNFRVGAAVRMASGAIFKGCNIENASYGLTICAERVALYAAIASGEHSIMQLALVADRAEPVSPCGACRQVLSELAPGAQVLMASITGATSDATLQRATVAELLPSAFELPSKKRVV
jgi:cytidine deaminase